MTVLHSAPCVAQTSTTKHYRTPQSEKDLDLYISSTQATLHLLPLPQLSSSSRWWEDHFLSWISKQIKSCMWRGVSSEWGTGITINGHRTWEHSKENHDDRHDLSFFVATKGGSMKDYKLNQQLNKMIDRPKLEVISHFLMQSKCIGTSKLIPIWDT